MSMEIKEIYIRNFGKFSERRFTFEDGIQVIYGENEYGKSTLYAFIKAMLFGMERGRGKAARSDEFSRYEPWENSNYYAGMIRFTSGGKTFRLERNFDRYKRGASLVCEDDGEELSVEQGDLEILLGDMTAETFENTVAVRQLSVRPGAYLAAELKNYAANYYETGSSTVNLRGAVETLQERKKEAEREIKELERQREEKTAVVRQEYQYVLKDIEKLREEIEENKKKQNSLFERQRKTQRRQDSDKESTSPEAKENSGSGFIQVGLAGIAVGVIGKLWSVVMSSQAWFSRGEVISFLAMGLIAVGIFFLAVGIVKKFCHGMREPKARKAPKKRGGAMAEKSRGEEKQEDTEEIKKIETGEETALQHLRWESERISSELREKQIYLENLQEELEEGKIPSEKQKNLRLRQEALLLAEKRLQEVSKGMTQSFGDILNRQASEILEEITDGRYTRLLIDGQLNMTLFENGRRIPLSQVSVGTAEQVYFALRMAAVGLLYEESMPVILDDTFAFYDEKRLESALKWLSKQQRQVIIFTCQRREAEILARLREKKVAFEY